MQFFLSALFSLAVAGALAVPFQHLQTLHARGLPSSCSLEVESANTKCQELRFWYSHSNYSTNQVCTAYVNRCKAASTANGKANGGCEAYSRTGTLHAYCTIGRDGGQVSLTSDIASQLDLPELRDADGTCTPISTSQDFCTTAYTDGGAFN